jgi:prevent-host-death family protein
MMPARSIYAFYVQYRYKKGAVLAIVKVGTRELKSKLSEYLRRVKGGETIVVTNRGKSIGQITARQNLFKSAQANLMFGSCFNKRCVEYHDLHAFHRRYFRPSWP